MGTHEGFSIHAVCPCIKITGRSLSIIHGLCSPNLAMEVLQMMHQSVFSKDERLNCEGCCFNLPPEDYVQCFWKMDCSDHVTSSFYDFVALLTFLLCDEHSSIHFLSALPWGPSCFFSFSLANNAHWILIKFLLEYITVIVVTPPCLNWLCLHMYSQF